MPTTAQLHAAGLRLFGSPAGPVSRGIMQSVVTSENLSPDHDSAPEASKLLAPPSALSESRALRADIPQNKWGYFLPVFFPGARHKEVCAARKYQPRRIRLESMLAVVFGQSRSS